MTHVSEDEEGDALVDVAPHERVVVEAGRCEARGVGRAGLGGSVVRAAGAGAQGVGAVDGGVHGCRRAAAMAFLCSVFGLAREWETAGGSGRGCDRGCGHGLGQQHGHGLGCGSGCGSVRSLAVGKTF